MGKKDMEKFFNAQVAEKIDVVGDNIEESKGEITIADTNSPARTDIEDLILVKPQEVRENYDTSKTALVKNLTVGGELLDQISKSLSDNEPDHLEDDDDGGGKKTPNNRLYETAGALMKAINDTAKTLASLHQEAGNILGDVKKVEIDNSHKELNVSASDLNDMVKILKAQE